VKELAILAIAILLPAHSLAQRGGSRGAGRGVGVPGHFVLPPARPILQPLNPIVPNGFLNGRGSPLSGRFTNGYGRYGGYGGYGGGIPYGGCYGCQDGYLEGGNQAPMNIVVPVPYGEAAPDPRPAPSEVREYRWPNDAPNKPGAAFSIVSTEGTVYRADMVCVQGDAVRFFTPEGTELELPLASVDRARTREANAGLNVKLQLPPGN
jgi:hypothetical protein